MKYGWLTLLLTSVMAFGYTWFHVENVWKIGPNFYMALCRNHSITITTTMCDKPYAANAWLRYDYWSHDNVIVFDDGSACTVLRIQE
jgi:hypothetical protein